MAWDLSCPDWRDRLRTGRSLVPDLPLTEDGDRAVRVFNKLRLADVLGTPTMEEAGGDWFRDIVRALFGSFDPVAQRRMIQELFLLVPKKNSKTTNGALLMLTALLLNRRPNAPFLLTAPVQKTADEAFSAIAGAIALDPVLEKKLHVRDHLKVILHRETKAKLEVMTFDPAIITGRKVVGAIDKHLERLKTHEKSVAAKARTVEGTTTDKGTQSRASSGPTIIIKGDKEEAFKGQNYTRIVIAKTLARLEGISAIGIAKHRWGQSNPLLVDVVRAAVEGGGTGTGEWGAELAEADTRYTGDFIEYLYGQTVYDQLPLRVVPANIVIKGQDGAATAYWVGESKSIPVTKVDFMDVELKYKKVAALAVVSKELLRESSPSAEMLVRDALVQASSQRVDQTFLGSGGASDSTPAGILNGVVGISSAGSDGDGVREDLKALRAAFINAKNSGGQQLVMHPGLADAIGLLTNALGQAEFPDITAEGGSLRRTPVKTGDNVNPNHLIMLKPSDIWKIGDRGVEVSLSTEASIEMDNAPTGASDTPVANTSLVSMFQTESVALKVVRPLNFAKRRTSAVAYISDADYGQATSSP